MRVHTGKALLAGVAALALGLTACSSSGGGGNTPAPTGTGGGSPTSTGSNNNATAGTAGTGAFTNCATQQNTCNSGNVKPGGTIVYTLEKTPAGWNNNLAASNVFETGEMLDGILPSVYNASPDLKPFLNTDLMKSAASVVKNGKQILTYKIQPNAVWNDGTPINYDDFKYTWDWSDPSHCKDCGPASTSGYTSIGSMKSEDNGKTVVVTMKQPFGDWQSMFSNMLPAHIAKAHGDDGTSKGINTSFQWFNKDFPTYSGGPLQMTKYVKNTSATEVPNPKWYGKTKPAVNQVIFRMITDQTAEAPALQNGEVDALYPQPNTDLLNAVKGISGTQYYIGKGLNWEHFNLNEKNQFLKDKTLRTAIFTAVNRQDIVNRTIGTFVPGASTMGSHMYVPGQAGYQDNVTPLGLGAGNVDKAKQLLTSAGYTGVGSALKTSSGTPVKLRCTYSAGNTFRQTECTLMQTTLKELGIPVTLKTTQDLSELGNGNFDIIVFAWVGTPFPVAGAQQIYTTNGGTFGAYTHNSDPQADALINKAVTELNPTKVQSLLNQADVLLEKDCFELPLYQKPTMLAAKSDLVNMRDNATSVGPPYNVQEWGVKAS